MKHLLLTLALLLGALGAEAQAKHSLSVATDTVEWRSDVTRVHCRLKGIPHTSHRVDSVAMTAGSKRFVATDIDPIYFTRSFQWEDDGVIPVEIDFAPMKARKQFTLIFYTPYGQIRTK